MSWSPAVLWWIAAGVLVAVELATGSFYLLMLALGAAAAALGAHAGLGGSAQLVAAALVGGGAVVAWHRLHRDRGDRVSTAANRDLNLDIGERVHVVEWRPDGSTTVEHRGSRWAARYAGADAPAPGEHVIQAIEGSRLLLAC
ncbi:MAG TPA: NfeD family protein [Methylibium sp.]|uniref:NfeD family protein n=1 Tax=Methylibium sp. TaxID=2067992 RepID=UPI002DB7BD49|nr:NfeD family protein [Methylibium sp.]HEU4458897.1 NfeD family protein [Methylibium sp.]